MPFQVSPGVNVSEIDLTTTTPAVSVSTGAIVGRFSKGPVNQLTTITSETELVNIFGAPNETNYRSFFSAANFLAYSGDLRVCRVVGSAAKNAVNGVSETTTPVFATLSPVAQPATTVAIADGTQTTYTLTRDTFGETPTATLDADGSALAIDTVSGSEITFSSAPGGAFTVVIPAQKSFALSSFPEGGSATVTAGDVTFVNGVDFDITGATTSSIVFKDSVDAPASGSDAVTLSVTIFSSPRTSASFDGAQFLDSEPVGLDADVQIIAKHAGQHANGIQVYMADSSATFNSLDFGYYSGDTPNNKTEEKVKRWRDNFNSEPEAGFVHVVVASGPEVLEVYESLSKSSSGRLPDGSNIYYMEYVNEYSPRIYIANHPANMDWGTGASTSMLPQTYSVTLGGGVDGDSGSDIDSAFSLGMDLLADPETVDFSIWVTGEAADVSDTAAVQNAAISIAESRKDVVVVVSPPAAACLSTTPESDIVDHFAGVTNSNYAFADSNCKYQYDKYNDKYRWVPMNGDIAGLMARTDDERDPWFSPAGFNRGIIKNVVKVAWNQTKANRDTLYKKSLNPVVTFPGQGTVLFGDKTFTSKPSAFDRINVRRLFITLEKTISNAAQFTLFEMNDEFTRSQFVSLVEPFLREVKGRRGIFDFLVVCDSTNNTPQVVDSNQFVGDIFIKPSRSINFIQLNFVATRTGTNFEEIVGSV